MMEYSQNFIGLYTKSFRSYFDYPALSNYGTDVRFTYGETAKEIAKLHLLFKEYDVRQGEKIALIGKNNAYWCVIFMASITYGAVIVPILQDFSPADIQNIVNHSGSTLLFVSDSMRKTLDEKQMTSLKAVFPFSDKSLPADLYSSMDKKFAEKYPNGFTAEDINYQEFPNENLVILNYTSGTTGFSKGVLLTGNNLVGNLAFAHQEMPVKKGDNLVSLLPLAHAYGCGFEFLFPIKEGCHVILLGKTPSPNIVLSAFSEYKPALIIAVPLILEKIYKRMIVPVTGRKSFALALKIPLLNQLLYSVIRKKLVKAFGGQFIQVIIGGAPLNAEVEEFLLKIKFPISVGYGMTECSPLISFSLYPKYIPLSCGKILPNMEIRVDSPDPYNIVGEIQVKGQNVMLGYYNNEQATKEVFTDDGWLKTGDLGTIDKNNNVFIRGRLKDMMLSATGQNIYPEEIEAKLNNLPYINDSLVVGRNGKLIAMVYPDYETAKQNGVSSDDLCKIMDTNVKTLNEMVASYEKIAEIQLTDEFKKTPKRSIKRYLYI
ncbi:MAG: AMP-binding protein [Dysgonamonadaceae bacterium]|jgi:long-chain acyl-CoA synthetase|nr:AMP-binding protein [Dysgonamonadaceae bacterium]